MSALFRHHRHLIGSATAAALLFSMPVAAYAQQRTHRFEVPAQDLGSALKAVAAAAGEQVIFDGAVVRGKRSTAVSGTHTTDEALDIILRGSGLGVSRSERGIIVVAPQRQSDAADVESGPAGAEEIIVTGTRIRGAVTPTPVIQVTQQDIKDGGFTNLGDVIRSIPQNFSGGQNPGVALGAGGITNQNLTQGSALNLRGLGPDATLTLLNGRRLSYNGFIQAVDVSVVPINALSRIEIVAEGASAIYGSDAVAGVANIILRRDFDGLDTTAMLALPTDGGGREYKLSATAGTTWNSGGIIAAYEFSDANPVFANQRDYTDYMPDPASIFPSRRQHSALVSAHHNLTDSIEVKLDALYTHRTSSGLISTQPTQRVFQGSKSKVFVLSPSVEFSLPADWSMTVGGTYGQDETISDANIFTPAGAPLNRSKTCYCNKSYSAELDAEGPLFALPGGDLRMAVGAGYRRNELTLRSFTSPRREHGARSSYYAYGELYAPLLGPDQDIGFVHRLTATAAFRYEDYKGIGSITTPKFGLIFEPTPDFSLRGSWGRSFKTPTLLQEFSESILYLWSASDLGGGFPPGSTVLMPYGGNRNLKPERAETWSATLAIHPRAIEGLLIEIGYFDIDYRDRVLQPVAEIFDALSNPNYADFIALNPSSAQIAEALASSPTGGITFNFAGVPYDPANVVAIVNNLYANVARSSVKGVDLSATYSFDLGGGNAKLNGSATWLKGRQQNSAGQPGFQTVGLFSNPPKFRARGGFTWNRDGLTLAAFVNHIGSVVDDRFGLDTKGDSFTTVDATIRYRTGADRGLLGGMEFALSAQNLFDQAPPLVTPLVDYVVNYDSTNYSPMGRVLTLSVTKYW